MKTVSDNSELSLRFLNGEQFAKGTLITFTAGILNLFTGIVTSIILARVLGPQNMGIYTLAILLPTLIVTFSNLGIGVATVYYVAQKEFKWQEILGNNILLSLCIGGGGVLIGLAVIFFFSETFFPNVATRYLFLALVLVPVEVFFSYVSYVLLGAHHIKEFNFVQITRSVLFLGFVVLALTGLKAGVTGTILAGLLTLLVVNALVLWHTKAVTGGIEFGPNTSYIKRATTYGIQAHISNILGFLNYRIDMFLVNGFLGPAAVGLYAVGVWLVEKLWLISHSASTVLFPKIAAENKEERNKDFTPFVSRTVLWMTAMGALVLLFFSHWIVLLFFGKDFLPTVSALQALLVGIVSLSVGRVLSNDISGRGRPGLNIYIGGATVITNVVLNILWIPRYGIVGAAWASTVSYTIAFLIALFFYCRLSGNAWSMVLLPQRNDWALYWRIARGLGWHVKNLTERERNDALRKRFGNYVCGNRDKIE